MRIIDLKNIFKYVIEYKASQLKIQSKTITDIINSRRMISGLFNSPLQL